MCSRGSQCCVGSCVDQAPWGCMVEEKLSLPRWLGLNELCVLVGGVAWVSVPLPLSPCQCAFAQCTECTDVHSVPNAIHFICVPVSPSQSQSVPVCFLCRFLAWPIHCVFFSPCSLIFNCPVGFCCCCSLFAFLLLV